MSTVKLTSDKKEKPASKAIQKIYNKFGGTNACAAKLGVSGQHLSNWKIKGQVPISRLAWASQNLECDPMVLNKEDLTELLLVLKAWGYVK